MSRLRDGLLVLIVVIIMLHFLWGAIAPLLSVALALLVVILLLQAFR